jgi:hypothetical protein
MISKSMNFIFSVTVWLPIAGVLAVSLDLFDEGLEFGDQDVEFAEIGTHCGDRVMPRAGIENISKKARRRRWMTHTCSVQRRSTRAVMALEA